MSENMFYGASHLIFKMAESLRGRMTPSEVILWDYLRINDWKLKFRRQHPIAFFIADFYCHSVKLVIEIDGGYHKIQEVKINDDIRQKEIEHFGITVLRFNNEEVAFNLENVKKTIKDKIDELLLKKKELKDLSREVANSPLGQLANTSLGEGRGTPLGDGGKLYVVKIGGNVIDDEAKLAVFLKDFSSIDGYKILVHGGGKLATRVATAMGIEQQMVDGRRITDAETLKVVTMVYAGYINKNIVALLQANGCNAMGLTGADGNAILAHKRGANSTVGKAGVDYGFAGDVDWVNGSLLDELLNAGQTPVLAPITHNGQGQLLNTNADTIASATAIALSDYFDVRLVYCFEKKGVLENVDDDESVIGLINRENFSTLKEAGKLFAGILPKIENAFSAIDKGVNEVLIGHADDLITNTTDKTAGTLIQ